MDGGAWFDAVHGVAKSRTRLNDFTFTFHFHALEKEMATHSTLLAWRIPGMGEPGGLPSMGSHRVGHDWSDLAAAAGLLGHMVVLFLVFLRNLHDIFLSDCTNLFSRQLSTRASFSPHPCQHLYFQTFWFDDSHSDGCEVISSCDFGFHFFDV